MPIHVKVLSQADYAKWVDGKMKEMAALADDPNKVWKLDELVARGEKVYAANCAACHRPTARAPARSRRWTAARSCSTTRGADQRSCSTAPANGAMPAWKHLSDTEIAAVITYTKNAWGNKTGKLVQPAEIVAARK
jgi:cytochrome c oxidase subunit II